MTLRAALDDYKRTYGQSRVFPGERRTTDGHFSGLDSRLVYVARDGSLRDYSAPLCGRHGIERSRFGLRVDGEIHWFEDATSVEQLYLGATALVETTFDFGTFTVDRTDLTLGQAHLTHVDVTGADPDSVVAVVSFAPDGETGRVGQLVFEDPAALSTYHRDEHDLLAAATGFESVRGEVPERFGELLETQPVDFPRSNGHAGAYESERLTGTVVVEAPVENSEATLASLLAGGDDDVAEAATRVADLADEFNSKAKLAAAATEQAAFQNAAGTVQADPPAGTVQADLRVLQLLAAESGAHVAGPDFDPFYANSGGYGYTWFRDDAEIARYLLAAADPLDLDLAEWHAKSAAFYRRTQRADGTWPHRVWPTDGSLAPGWANARIEGGDTDYQADQTASVVAFLASYLRLGDPADPSAVAECVRDGLDGLDRTLDADGLPETCQNAWENMAGRFTHTAATFLQAYAECARAGVDPERAETRARTVFDALDEWWLGEKGVYALREHDGRLDDRLDSSTLALADAHRSYAALAGIDALAGTESDRLDRLATHVEATLAGLYREPGPVSGLARFSDDDWRQRDQDAPKIWTVSTAWGAHAAGVTADLLDAAGRDSAPFERWRDDLLAELLPEGSLCLDSGYLPEQVFDDGTPDSATPLGWPHALRLATVAELDS